MIVSVCVCARPSVTGFKVAGKGALYGSESSNSRSSLEEPGDVGGGGGGGEEDDDDDGGGDGVGDDDLHGQIVLGRSRLSKLNPSCT